MKKVVMSVVRFVFKLVIVVLFLPIVLCLGIVHLFGMVCVWLEKVSHYLEDVLEKLADSYLKYWGGVLRVRK